MPPDEVIQTMKDSVLRGRGGAGFPTGLKSGFIPKGGGKPLPRGERGRVGTGRVKDMPTLLANPHALVEGLMIASYAINAAPGLHRARRGTAGDQQLRHTIVAEARKRATSAPTSSAPGSTSTS